ncbi:MAG: hypothetical protein WAM28_00465 [Chlamydiales bacterium]
MAVYINQIFSVFHNLPDSYTLIINDLGENRYAFTASSNCDEAECIQTQNIFKKIFDKSPFQEVIEQYSHSRLTKSVLREIFVKIAAFNDKGPSLNFSSLEDFEHTFLDKAPKESSFLKDRAWTSGRGFKGLCEKVYLQWHHYFTIKSECDPEKIEIRQAEFLTSRMADREFQEGTYVYLAKGEIFQVDKTIVCQGAYISILKNISNPAQAKIICRGTAMRLNSTDAFNSVLNNLQYEIGNGGIQAAWPYVSHYLHQQNVREVELYGKSLGGAHAQRLAILIMKYSSCFLKGLTTVCSVGVGSEAEVLFKDLVERDECYRSLNLTVIRNGGEAVDKGADYVPFVGGDHLGATVDPKDLNLRLYYIHPLSERIFAPNHNIGFIRKLVRFVLSFFDAHFRQNTLLDFSYQSLKNRAEIQSSLKFGTLLEWLRRIFTYRNTISFTDFVSAGEQLVSVNDLKIANQ